MLTDTIPRELTRKLLDALESDADLAMRREAFDELRDLVFPIVPLAADAAPKAPTPLTTDPFLSLRVDLEAAIYGTVADDATSIDLAHLITTIREQFALAALAPSDGHTERKSLANEILDSLRSGYLFGNHDEPLDAASRRILRVIQQRLP